MNVFMRQHPGLCPPQLNGPELNRPRRLTVVAAAVVLVIIAIALALFMRPRPHAAQVQTQNQRPVLTVNAHTVALQPVESRVSASGSVAPRYSIDIGAEVSGLRIVEINVEQGDYVRKGQVLARLNSDILESQLASQRAQLAARQANVSKVRQPNRSEDIAGLEAALLQAKASVTQAQANVARAELNVNNLRTNAARFDLLGKEGAVSAQEAQDKRTAANMAATEVEATKQQLEAAKYAASQAEQRLQLARHGGRSEDIAISLSDVAQTRAGVRQVEAQLKQTIISAPSDGLITKRLAEPGEISAAGQAMFSMTRDNTLELQAQIQEVDLPAVQVGQKVTITPASPQLGAVEGVVREVSPTVDVRTRLGIAYIRIPPAAGLKEGMYANAQITVGQRQSAAVPTKSISANEREKAVFTLSSNHIVHRRAVQTGTVNGDFTEIISGLTPGETIVEDGGAFLKDGDLVTVK